MTTKMDLKSISFCIILSWKFQAIIQRKKSKHLLEFIEKNQNIIWFVNILIQSSWAPL